MYDAKALLAGDENALADAIEAGYVVMEDGIVAHGQDIWHEFYDSYCRRRL